MKTPENFAYILLKKGLKALVDVTISPNFTLEVTKDVIKIVV